MEVRSIAEQLFFTTVRIKVEVRDRVGAGTGFCFNYVVDDKSYIFLVTNKHVVDGANRGRLIFNVAEGDRPKLSENFTVVIDNFEHSWFDHPEQEIDVAITPLAPILNKVYQDAGKRLFFKSITKELIPDDKQLSQIDAIEEVVFIGYPNGLFDTVNNTPIARTGITATPIALNYRGKKQFLIDASVFPGSSGSPVFILNRGSHPTKEDGLVVGSRLFFIGIVAAVVFEEETGRIEISEIPTARTAIVRTKQMIDLGVVFKARTIVEAVEEFLRRR